VIFLRENHQPNEEKQYALEKWEEETNGPKTMNAHPAIRSKTRLKRAGGLVSGDSGICIFVWEDLFQQFTDSPSWRIPLQILIDEKLLFPLMKRLLNRLLRQRGHDGKASVVGMETVV
jgi:hypothetical protein